MEILVCIKRVPDTAENEIEVNRDGTDIERDDLVYSVNEWDNYAVEEAIQIRDKVGGNVTVVSVGDENAEEVVRREMAMGADQGILLSDDVFEGSDGKGVATILKAEIEKGKYDLILTGAQADDGAGQVGECWRQCLIGRLHHWSIKSKLVMIKRFPWDGKLPAATRK
jgi:electron transfer flavoprotein beta subunit